MTGERAERTKNDAAPVQPAPAPSVRDIDVIYRESDRLYYEVARGCGLGITAFWALVKIVFEGGSTTQAAIVSEYSYSRQTVNSAVKTLEAKGLVCIGTAETAESGACDRRTKVVSLTAEGEAFCREHICPAIEAEERAFDSLAAEDQAAFVRIVRAYTDAMEGELGKIKAGSRESKPSRNPAQAEKAAAKKKGE